MARGGRRGVRGRGSLVGSRWRALRRRGPLVWYSGHGEVRRRGAMVRRRRALRRHGRMVRRRCALRRPGPEVGPWHGLPRGGALMRPRRRPRRIRGSMVRRSGRTSRRRRRLVGQRRRGLDWRRETGLHVSVEGQRWRHGRLDERPRKRRGRRRRRLQRRGRRLDKGRGVGRKRGFGRRLCPRGRRTLRLCDDGGGCEIHALRRCLQIRQGLR